MPAKKRAGVKVKTSPGASPKDYDMVTSKEFEEERARLRRMIPKCETALPLVAYMMKIEIETRQKQERIISPNGSEKKKKKKKVAITQRLKNAFSFRRIGSHAVMAVAIEDEDEYGGVSRKMSVSKFSDEDFALVEDDEFTTAGSTYVTPKTPSASATSGSKDDLVIESLSPSKLHEEGGDSANDDKTASSLLSPKSAANAKYPSVMEATRIQHLKLREQQEILAIDMSKMVLLHETLKLFWRLGKTMNVMVYGNKQGALCVMVYNKYNARTYNSLYFHRDTVLKLVTARNERIEQNSPKKTGQIGISPKSTAKTAAAAAAAGGVYRPNGTVVQHSRDEDEQKAAAAVVSSGGGGDSNTPNPLSAAVLEYIISDELHFIANGGNLVVGTGASGAIGGGVGGGGGGATSSSSSSESAGAVVALRGADGVTNVSSNEDDSQWVLALRGVDTVGTAEELASMRPGIQLPHGVYRLKAVAMSRTMSDCHVMAETIASGLKGNFSQLGQESKQAAEMLEQARKMIQQLEEAGRMLLDSTPEEEASSAGGIKPRGALPPGSLPAR
jgi:hypothetical protein